MRKYSRWSSLPNQEQTHQLQRLLCFSRLSYVFWTGTPIAKHRRHALPQCIIPPNRRHRSSIAVESDLLCIRQDHVMDRPRCRSPGSGFVRGRHRCRLVGNGGVVDCLLVDRNCLLDIRFDRHRLLARMAFARRFVIDGHR